MIRSIAKHIVLAGSLAIATTALADGMPRGGSIKDAPVAAAPTFSWTGFYIGAHGGLGRSRASYGVNTGNAGQLQNRLSGGTVEDDGAAWGGQIGFNWHTGGVVFGIEADYTSLDLAGTSVVNFPNNGGAAGIDTNSISADYLATVRARIGFAYDRALFYLTGGWAGTDATYANTIDQAGFGGCPALGNGFNRCFTGSAGFKSGWTIGGGIEYALLKNWTVKLEYLHADFGKVNFSQPAADAPAVIISHNADLTLNVAKIGVNFKF